MDDFRHNLTPVEVKNFLKITADLTRNLLILYCFKLALSCPECGRHGICQGGAVSLFSSRLDKITHEIKACLDCGYRQLSTVLTIEAL